jgi:two-component sensor histidine kinase
MYLPQRLSQEPPYLALAFNELGTNAEKYGALSVPDGSVGRTGKFDATAKELVLTWVESGGPLVHEPTRRNFGTRLMQGVLPRPPKLEFRPSGVVCRLWVPLALDA